MSRSTRIWLHNRHAHTLATDEHKTKQKNENRPTSTKPSRDKARLRPLSTCAVSSLQQLWQSYADMNLSNKSFGHQAIALSQMELVGAVVKITRSGNPCNVLLSGTVIDESEKMLYIQANSRILHIPKQGTHFEILVQGRPIILLGQGIDRAVPSRTKAKQRRITNLCM